METDDASELLRSALKDGADPNHKINNRTRRKWSLNKTERPPKYSPNVPLICAVMFRKPWAIKLLVEFGADVDVSIKFVRYWGDDGAKLNWRLERFYPPDVRENVPKQRYLDICLVAIKENRPACLRELLLLTHFRPNGEDSLRDAYLKELLSDAFRLAVLLKRRHCFNILLQHCENPTLYLQSVDENWRTPIHLSLLRTCSFRRKNPYGKIDVDFVAALSRIAGFKEVAHRSDRRGLLPIHYAVDANCPNAIDVLFRAAPDTLNYGRNSRNLTPLRMALTVRGDRPKKQNPIKKFYVPKWCTGYGAVKFEAVTKIMRLKREYCTTIGCALLRQGIQGIDSTRIFVRIACALFESSMDVLRERKIPLQTWIQHGMSVDMLLRLGHSVLDCLRSGISVDDLPQRLPTLTVERSNRMKEVLRATLAGEETIVVERFFRTGYVSAMECALMGFSPKWLFDHCRRPERGHFETCQFIICKNPRDVRWRTRKKNARPRDDEYFFAIVSDGTDRYGCYRVSPFSPDPTFAFHFERNRRRGGGTDLSTGFDQDRILDFVLLEH